MERKGKKISTADGIENNKKKTKKKSLPKKCKKRKCKNNRRKKNMNKNLKTKTSTFRKRGKKKRRKNKKQNVRRIKKKNPRMSMFNDPVDGDMDYNNENSQNISNEELDEILLKELLS